MKDELCIHSIIVTYKPDEKRLNECINSLIPQVNKVIIVDNTPQQENKDFFMKLSNIFKNKVEIVDLGDNYGIAYAQNVGIKKSLEENVDFLIFSDQDTVYPHDYVIKMIEIFNKYKEDFKIAAVAPFFRDKNANNEIMPIMVYENNKIKKIRKFSSDRSVYFASHVISSGMIVSKEAIIKIGPMKEELFIDWVDTEWCFRANMLGWKILQTGDVIIEHKHGESSKKILHFILTKHNPLRRYYRVRNAVYLLIHEQNLNFSIRKYILISLFKMFIMHFLQTKDKLKEVKNKYYAIKDGLLKKLGKTEREFDYE